MNFGSLPRIRVDISNGKCKRECPYIKEAEPNHMPLPDTRVGSFLCRRCSHFGMYEARSKSVVCKFIARNDHDTKNN